MTDLDPQGLEATPRVWTAHVSREFVAEFAEWTPIAAIKVEVIEPGVCAIFLRSPDADAA